MKCQNGNQECKHVVNKKQFIYVGWKQDKIKIAQCNIYMYNMTFLYIIPVLFSKYRSKPKKLHPTNQ